MASSEPPKDEPAKTPAAKPIYHVVKLDPASPTGLLVVATNVQAATQVKAMDEVGETMEGKFTLGAFLASSFKTKSYENALKPTLTGEVVEITLEPIRE